MLLIFRDSFPPTSGLYFVKEKGRSAGALSGDPEDIYRTDALLKELFPENQALHRWIDMAQKKSHSKACRPVFAGSATVNGKDGARHQ